LGLILGIVWSDVTEPRRVTGKEADLGKDTCAAGLGERQVVPEKRGTRSAVLLLLQHHFHSTGAFASCARDANISKASDFNQLSFIAGAPTTHSPSRSRVATNHTTKTPMSGPSLF